MKRIFLIFAFMVAMVATQAQYQTLTITAGTDSIQDAVDTYFYLNGVTGTTNSTVGANRVKATSPITQYEIIAIMAGTTHAAVSGSGDSTRVTIEVSLDNSNWFQWQIVPAQTIGTGMIDQSSYYFGTLAASGFGLWKPTAGTGIWPYMRVKFDNDATGHKFPKAYAIIKKL